MAKLRVMMPEEFTEKLSRLGASTDEIIEKVLTAGASATFPRVKTNLQQALSTEEWNVKRRTGELLESLGVTSVQVDHRGRHNVKIGFNDPRKKQYAAKGARSYGNITNAMIANVLEYGKSGQTKKPFMKTAVKATEKARYDAMKRALDKEINSL